MAAAACRVYRVAGVPVKESIFTETKDKQIVEPSTRKFFSGMPVLADKEATKRYMQERDKKYNQDADSGALWGNHLKDVEFGLTLGIKPGKLTFDDADDNDNDNDNDDDTEPAKKIRKLNSDIQARRDMNRDLRKTDQQLEHRLKIQEGVNENLRAEIEQAKKHQESIESLQKREAEFTEIGKELREKGLESPEGKQLIHNFMKVAHDDVQESAV